MDSAALNRKILLAWTAAVAVLLLVLFVPAGTLDYWQAWLYMAVILVPAAFVVLYFLKKDPEFLERRMMYREKEAAQRSVIGFGILIFIIGFVIPGLDRRFGWSQVPPSLVLFADVLVLAGYAFVAVVFMENSYAGRTVRVEKGQTVVTTGLYSVIRHPMYLGTLVLYLATPIALGSYWAFPVFALTIPMIVMRILNEEEVLRRELPGYTEYCNRTRYRLVPFIW